MGMTLRDLLRELQEAGVVGEEAEEVVEAFIAMQRASRKSQLARRGPAEVAPTFSPQADGRRPVDYGHETPAEAKARWLRQESEDPEGFFAGGATGGGIFGQGPVAFDNYDPAAQSRSFEAVAMRRNVEVQERTADVLTKILDRLAAPPELPGREPPLTTEQFLRAAARGLLRSKKRGKR